MRKNILALAIMCSFLVGCGPTIYENVIDPSLSDQRLQWDAGNCKSYARGMTPLPPQTPVPQISTTYGSGTIYTPDGHSILYTYTETNIPNPYQQMGASINNLASTMNRIHELDTRFDECMRYLGWVKVDSNTKKIYEEYYNSSENEYADCLEIKARELSESIQDYNILKKSIHDQCQEKTGQNENDLAGYYANKYISQKSANRKTQ